MVCFSLWYLVWHQRVDRSSFLTSTGVENGGGGCKTAVQSMHIAFIFMNINDQLEK